METVALYMRLSSEDANEGESCSISNQRDLLRAYVRENREFADCNILEFLDDGYSGLNFERPGVQRLLSLAGKSVDCIIVKDFSRFGRNLIEVGDYLDRIFPFLGVRFIAVNEGYDSKANFGRTVGLDVSLKAMIYEMYSRDISEKIKCVRREKAKKGEYLCGIAFYGYRKSETEKNHLEVDEPAADVVKQIFEMAAEGMPMMEIAKKLNMEGILSPLMYRRANHTDGLRGWKVAGDVCYWTWEAVKRIITDERYTGCFVGNKKSVTGVSSQKMKVNPREEWIVVENAHAPIVTKELFTRAQTVVSHREKVKSRGEGKVWKFRGILKCGYCGKTLLKSNSKAEPYFFCRTGKQYPDGLCPSVRLYEKDLEKNVLVSIHAQIRFMNDKGGRAASEKDSDMQDWRNGNLNMAENVNHAIKECKETIIRYKTAQITAFEDYAEGSIDKDRFLRRKKELAERQKETEEKLAVLYEEFASMQGQEISETGTETNMEQYLLATEPTREMLEQFVKEIRIRDTDKLEIIWNSRE